MLTKEQKYKLSEEVAVYEASAATIILAKKLKANDGKMGVVFGTRNIPLHDSIIKYGIEIATEIDDKVELVATIPVFVDDKEELKELLKMVASLVEDGIETVLLKPEKLEALKDYLKKATNSEEKNDNKTTEEVTQDELAILRALRNARK